MKALSTYARSTARQASRKSRFSAVTAAAGGAGAASQAAAATAVVAVPRSRVDRDGCSGGGGQSPGGGLEGRGEAKVGATRGSALPRRRLARRPPRLPHAHPAGSETDRTTDGPRGGARPRAAGGRGRIREGATGERAVGTVRACGVWRGIRGTTGGEESACARSRPRSPSLVTPCAPPRPPPNTYKQPPASSITIQWPAPRPAPPRPPRARAAPRQSAWPAAPPRPRPAG